MDIKPVKSEQDRAKALRRVGEIWNAAEGTKSGDELEILSILVENYESKHHAILPPDPVEAIKFRMEQLGLTKSGVAPYLGGRNRSTEILKRKRGLSIRMMRTLHQKLKIPAESLLGR